MTHRCPDYEPCIPCAQQEAYEDGVQAGGAVVFGMLGMAEAIRERDWFCATCNNMTSGELYCWVCNEYRGSPDRSADR